MNRIDRLTAILIHLQTKRVVKAEEIADRFEISLRTVYRDVKALMEAGVPIGSEAGKGYFIVNGFHLPPIMFNPEEASAMLLASKLVEKMTDHSVRKAFESALMKIKAVLNDSEKDRLESLHSHIEIFKSSRKEQPEFPNHFLTDIQKAVVQKEVLHISYLPGYKDESSEREIEPIGLYYYSSGWHLIGWCRLRSDYRDFRADRIRELLNTGKKFDNRNLLSIQQYIAQIVMSHGELESVVICFDKSAVRFVSEQKYNYGYVSEEDLGEKVKMNFLTSYTSGLAKWLLMFGGSVEVISPEKFKVTIVRLLTELSEHHKVYVTDSVP
jgi:predicted DNA-binding transcriptional regulator YafY